MFFTQTVNVQLAQFLILFLLFILLAHKFKLFKQNKRTNSLGETITQSTRYRAVVNLLLLMLSRECVLTSKQKISL